MVCSAPQLELNEDEAEEERSDAARSHDKRFSGRICHMCVVRAVERKGLQTPHAVADRPLRPLVSHCTALRRRVNVDLATLASFSTRKLDSR